MIGQITKILNDNYYVFYEGEITPCKLRGKVYFNNIKPFVGDYVLFSKDDCIIEEIRPRKNFLIRPQVANINQAIIITSLKHPNFDTNLLDKLLVVLECKNITPIICLTKKDLLNKDEYKSLKEIIKYYKKLGYKVLYNNEIFKIKRLFRNKTTVFTGQTGAGKSTLLNKLDKKLNFETNEISLALGRGKHTTRHVELVEIAHGKVLDTPGFSSIDLKEFTKEEIKDSFKEFKKYSCPYKDCMHLNEDECKVKKEVGKSILKSRYDNYKKIIG